MNKIVLTATVLTAVCCSAFGQTQKGKAFYSFAFDFSKTTRDQVNSNGISSQVSSNVNLGARAGFFVKDNLALGLGLGQQWQSSNDAGFSVRPFVRYYQPLGERFSGFLQGEVFYRTPGEFGFSQPRFGLNAGLGLVYFAHKRLSIEATTGLLSLVGNRIQNDANRGYTFNLGANLNANTLGLSVAFYTGANPSARTPTTENALVRGTRLLGGSFGLGGSGSELVGSTQTFRSTSLSLQPQIGWFVRDNVALGLTVGGTFASAKYNTVNPVPSQRSWSVSLQPFMRNYAMLGPKVGVFLESSVATGFGVAEFPTITATGAPITSRSRTFSFQAGIRPGITYFLGRRFAVEATTGFVGLNLQTSRTPVSSTVRGEARNNSFSFSPTWVIGSNVGVGLKYYVR